MELPAGARKALLALVVALKPASAVRDSLDVDAMLAPSQDAAVLFSRPQRFPRKGDSLQLGQPGQRGQQEDAQVSSALLESEAELSGDEEAEAAKPSNSQFKSERSDVYCGEFCAPWSGGTSKKGCQPREANGDLIAEAVTSGPNQNNNHFKYCKSKCDEEQCGKVNKEGLESFVCPRDCQECSTSTQGSYKKKEWFGCVLRRSVREARRAKLPRDSCTPPEKKSETTPAVAATHCKYTASEKRLKVWDKVSSLKEGFSKRMRCCCDAKGDAFCVGDKTSSGRLTAAYGVSLDQLLDRLPDGVGGDGNRTTTRTFSTRQGMCPKGFADYGVDGRPCECPDSACHSSLQAREPQASPRGLPDSALEVQMASLCSGVYLAESPIAGWEMVKVWDKHWQHHSKIDSDIAGIYARRLHDGKPPSCALVFSGTSSLKEMLQDMYSSYSNFCGGRLVKIHAGFAMKAKTFSNSSMWSSFVEYLVDEKTCGGGVYFAGHSLGGATAELFAACYNLKAKNGSTDVPTVDAVYTIGAPSVSLENPLTNAMSESGCFEGGRYFNQDAVVNDPIPAISSSAGFVHLKSASVRVVAEENGTTSYMRQECNGEAGVVENLQEPKLKFKGQLKTLFKTGGKMLNMHLANSYITRMTSAAQNPVLPQNPVQKQNPRTRSSSASGIPSKNTPERLQRRGERRMSLS